MMGEVSHKIDPSSTVVHLVLIPSHQSYDQVPGIGPATVTALEAEGITTTHQLLGR
jgi:hypothetical protein